MTTLDALLAEIGDDLKRRDRIIDRSRRQSLARQYVSAAIPRGRDAGAIADLLPLDLFREAMSDRHDDPAITRRILFELRRRIRLLRQSGLRTPPGHESAVQYFQGELMLLRWQLSPVEVRGQMFGGV